MSGISGSALLLCFLLHAGAATPAAAPSAASRPGPNAQREFFPSFPRDTLPPWRYVDMTQVVVEESGRWVPSEVEALELLAWYAQVDDRPLYVNVALFGVRLTGGRWALVQLAQNPIPDANYPAGTAARRTRWTLYYVTDVPWGPVALYSAKPTSRDVESFLAYWNDTGGWRVLSRGFRSQTWNAFLGVPAPTRLRALNLEHSK